MIAPTRSSRSQDVKISDRERERDREPVSAISLRRNPKGRQRDTPRGFYTDKGSDDDEDEGRDTKKKKRREVEEDDEEEEDSDEGVSEEDEDSEGEDDDDDDENNDDERRNSGPPHWSCSVSAGIETNEFTFVTLMWSSKLWQITVP